MQYFQEILKKALVEPKVYIFGCLFCFVVIGWTSYQTSKVEAVAGINNQINFQARLLNDQGATIPDGNRNIQFKIYRDGNGVPGGGDEVEVWSENWLISAGNGVSVKNGYLSVYLGKINTALASVDFNQDTMWLSINIGSTSSCTITTSFMVDCGGDGEMSPYKRFASNPYAMNAGKLGGFSSSQFLQLAQGVQVDNSTVNSSIFINKTGVTANILQLQRGGSDVLTVANGGAATFKNETNSSAAFKVQNTSDISLFTIDTAASKINFNQAVISLTGDAGGSVPTLSSVTAGDNTTGTLSGSPSITYYYKVSAMTESGETSASAEQSIAGSSFTPLSAPGAAAAAIGQNNGITGTFEYQITFVTVNGETTGGTTSNQVSPVNDKVNLTSIPTGPTGTIARNIYRCTVSSCTYELVTTLNDNSTTTYIDATVTPSGAIPGVNNARTDLNNATLTFNAIPGATEYRIYRGTSSNGQDSYQTTAAPPFNDSGAGGTAGMPPATGVIPRLVIGASIPTATLDVRGGVFFKNQVDTTAALHVQSASGDTLFKIDSTNNRLIVGNSTATSGADTTLLVVDSSVTANLPTGVNGGIVYDSQAGKFKIFENGQYKTLCNETNLACSAGGGGTLQQSYEMLNGNTIATTDARNISITLTNTATDANFLINVATSSTGKFATQYNGVDTFSISNAASAQGSALFKNAADNITAFQIQNAAGTSNLFIADTFNGKIGIGIAPVTTGSALQVTGGVQAKLSGVSGDNAQLEGTIVYDTTSGKFKIYEGAGGTLKTLCNMVDTNCGSGGAIDLQAAYNGSTSPATITTTAAGKGLKLAAGAVPTAPLLEITNAGQAITANNMANQKISFTGGSAAVEGSGLQIDFTPGGTTGGTWNGFRIVANATGAVSGVVENGIKIEGPSTPGAGTETAVKITTGWDIGLDVGSGGLQLASQTSPTTPAADNLKIYARKIAGRMILYGKGPSGFEWPIQPGLFSNSVSMCTPNTTTTMNSFGTNCTITATASHPTATETFGYATNFATSTTNGNESALSSANTQWIRGSTSGANGFFYSARIGAVDTLLTERIFSGLTDQTVATMSSSDNPAGHHVGFQISTSRADANWQFITKNGTTQTVTNTGMAYAANKVYDMYFFVAPQGGTIFWRIENVTDGTSQENSTTSNLPGATTVMRMVNSVECINCLTNGARNLRVSRVYIESDR